MLLGRERECARLDALISRVRGGSSAALVMEGEAGTGKTSLLDYVAAQARDLRVLRARGAESERDLPFAGLADLLGPVLGHLRALPDPQRAALAGALALGPAVPGDLFAVCAATLGLLAAAADARPVLVLVDDAHWLDAASARAVEFTARRLGRDAIGLMVTMPRMPGSSWPAHPWPDAPPGGTMLVAGLDEHAARQLLAGCGRAVAPAVARRLIEATGGNPLALTELPSALTQPQLSGLAVLPEPLPVGTALRRAFAPRPDALDDGTRRVLLLAAAAVVDVGTLRRASALLSLAGDLTQAEDAGLVRVRDGQVEFTHPLVRSACYYTARPDERRAAHRALAAVSDLERQPVRRAWHLAAGAASPDEDMADGLEQAARAASGQNAFAVASRAYQRAAEISVDGDRRPPRWVAAGQAAQLSGDPESAIRMLRRALDLAPDPLTTVAAEMLLAQAAVCAPPSMELVRELTDAADAVLARDTGRAAVLLASASDVCRVVGQTGLATETARRAVRLAAGTGGTGWLLSHASLAQLTIAAGDRAAGRRIISRVLDHPGARARDPVAALATMWCGRALIWCEEHQRAQQALGSVAGSASAPGRDTTVRYALASLADLHFRTGDWGRARAEAARATGPATDPGTGGDLGWALACAARAEAAMGAEDASREHIARAVGLARPARVALVWATAMAASGLLELGLANYAGAAADLAQAAALMSAQGIREPCLLMWRPDFIESLVALGRLAEAREQLEALDAEASSTGSRWAAAAAARCRGLLADTPEVAVARLEEAVAIAEASADGFEQARARLCLGRALRRVRRHGAARRQLREARAAFELLGAGPWAARATAQPDRANASAAWPDLADARLTPQELRVALHVAEGLSNQEVATRLFVSHKTIEVHLGHIYDKLGVRSRTSLARLVHTGDLQSSSSP